MAQPEGGAPGQQKTHTIKNTQTGETKEITQEEWRTNGKELKAAGWVRVDETGQPVPEEPVVNPLGTRKTQ